MFAVRSIRVEEDQSREKPKVPLVPFPLKARTLTSHTSADNSLFFTVRAT